jgi:hypothetical protein
MTHVNLFLKYADSILPRRRRSQAVKVVRSDHNAPRVLRGADQALAERSRQTARGRRWDAARLKELLAGAHGSQIKQLIRFLHRMTIDEGETLLAVLDELMWFADADHDLRMNVLAEIDDAIVMLRICNGLPPIDDALPGEELTVFQKVKQKLNQEDGAIDRDKYFNSYQCR